MNQFNSTAKVVEQSVFVKKIREKFQEEQKGEKKAMASAKSLQTDRKYERVVVTTGLHY